MFRKKSIQKSHHVYLLLMAIFFKNIIFKTWMFDDIIKSRKDQLSTVLLYLVKAGHSSSSSTTEFLGNVKDSLFFLNYPKLIFSDMTSHCLLIIPGRRCYQISYLLYQVSIPLLFWNLFQAKKLLFLH